MTRYCACGRPLHYKDLVLQQVVEDNCARMGEHVTIHVERGENETHTFHVQRHFIVLHGIRSQDLMRYGLDEVYRRANPRFRAIEIEVPKWFN